MSSGIGTGLGEQVCKRCARSRRQAIIGLHGFPCEGRFQVQLRHLR